jgi:DNA ligase-associated metallophosphoesterase
MTGGAGEQAEFDFDDRRTPLLPRTPAQISLCGAAFTADPSGVLYWGAQGTLIAADLHLEKGSSAAARGSLLPPYDSRATLERLSVVIQRLEPARVIALGDSFHDNDGPDRLAAEDLATLHTLQQGREWYWITGNHDPELPTSIGGRVCPSVTLGRIRFRHEPATGPASHEIAGHLHPAARLSRRGAAVRRKCFISNGDRLVLPAFGAYAGGMNVLSQAFKDLFGASDFLVWMLGQDGVFPVSRKQLLGD